MSSDIAIAAERLGKRYRIGEVVKRADTLRDAIAQYWRARHRGHDTRHLWALRDVSFEVPHGEVLGVIGRNGAGKSTLLKILSRITEPTEGRAVIRGRVASLLEVGVGFHPELSGRENIFVNGAILGMSRVEIARRFDEIVAFAEIERFLDTPVKHYSTGMQVRLAFAVAAHLEPEILLVDEVLAVGDAGFQKKCLGKMKDVGAGGRTVLFVSHNLSALANLCHRAILIDRGTLVDQGPAPELVTKYLRSFGTPESCPVKDRTDRYGDGRLRVIDIRLADGAGAPAFALRSGEAGQIVLRYACAGNERLRNVRVNLYLLSPSGERLCDLQTDFVGDNFERIPLDGEFICRFPRIPLQPGRYPFTFRVYSSERLTLDIVDNAGEIVVESGDFHGSGRMPEPGTIFIDHSWACRALPAAAVHAGVS